MAFDRSGSKFERLSGGAHKHYVYITPDPVATVSGAGYFNPVAHELDQFDMISVISESTGTPKVDTCIVTSTSRNPAVTVSAVEGVTATTTEADESEDEGKSKRESAADKAQRLKDEKAAKDKAKDEDKAKAKT